MLTVYQPTDNDIKSSETSKKQPRRSNSAEAFCAAMTENWENQWAQPDPAAEKLDQIS